MGDLESTWEAQPHDQLPNVEEVKAGLPDNQQNKNSVNELKSWIRHRPTAAWFLASVLLAGFVSGFIGVVILLKSEEESSPSSSSAEAHPSSATTTPTHMSVEDRLRAILAQPGGSPFVEGSYQQKALSQLQSRETFYASYSDQRLAQVYGLLSLYYSTNDSDEAWSTAPFWVHSEYECQWEGISCDPMGHVTAMDLSDLALNGVVPAELALVASAEIIHLDDNPGLTGLIPAFFGRMASLGKPLSRRGPYHVTRCGLQRDSRLPFHTVVELTLTRCGFVGNMPAEICQLKLDNEVVTIEADCLAQIACNAFCCERCT